MKSRIIGKDMHEAVYMARQMIAEKEDEELFQWSDCFMNLLILIQMNIKEGCKEKLYKFIMAE